MLLVYCNSIIDSGDDKEDGENSPSSPLYKINYLVLIKGIIIYSKLPSDLPKKYANPLAKGIPLDDAPPQMMLNYGKNEEEIAKHGGSECNQSTAFIPQIKVSANPQRLPSLDAGSTQAIGGPLLSRETGIEEKKGFQNFRTNSYSHPSLHYISLVLTIIKIHI